MTELEILEAEAQAENVEVINYPFSSDRIKGLYCDGTVALNKSLSTSAEKRCILAEELGHYHTSYGNITHCSTEQELKQEFKARIWSYNKLIGLGGIIECYNAGCHNLHEMAELLNTPEWFLSDALIYYKEKYGTCTTFDNYVIYFHPTLCVFKRI